MVVHLAREHSPKFEVRQRLLNRIQLCINFVDGRSIALFCGKFGKFGQIGESLVQCFQNADDTLEAGSLTAECLSALLVVPDFRISEFSFYFFETFFFASVVKDTPEA